jgi:general secretion pathway protein E
MVDMGIEPYLISGSLVAIQAQRLIRKICPHCKVEEHLPASVIEKYKEYLPEGTTFYKGEGCRECNGVGYMGREMISEVLPISDELSSMIAKSASKDDMIEQALKEGFEPMFSNGMKKVVNGVSTIEEILRVVKI